ncbi:glycosyltransferase family 4 protein [Halapricum desulfuricans]|nr:glycosyltransferase family 4 protein [Halapricum desulfuricans]
MDVTQVTHLYHPSFGGIENYVARLNASLSAAGHTSRTVTTDRSFAPGSTIEERPDVTYCETTFSVVRNPFSIELYRHLRADDSDVYHLHSPWFFPSLEAILALPDDAVVTMTVHGVHTPATSLLSRVLAAGYKPIAQYILNRVNRIFVLGPAERRRLTDRFDLADEQIAVVPNGIDPDAYDIPEERIVEFRDRYGIDPDVPTVLFVSRLVPGKQPEVLIEAVSDHLADETLQVLVVGKGEAGYVGSLVGRADDRVRFLSNLSFDELKAAYHAADCFVALGTSEGLSTVLLEAMNARLPVITTPAGANADVISGPEHGRVVDLHPEPAAVAAAIREMLADPDERAAIGERNRDRVRTEYAWDRVYESIEATYEELLAANEPR